jgi:hypothetical protein
VWSWRRDPGATLVGILPLATGARKAASPGRARISRKPLRGESRDVSAVPVKPVCVFYYPLHTVLAGAVGARLSLRPLFKEGATNSQTPGRKRAAGMLSAV